MNLLTKLERRLERLKFAETLTHEHSEERYYYAGRIEELEYVIDKIQQYMIDSM